MSRLVASARAAKVRSGSKAGVIDTTIWLYDRFVNRGRSVGRGRHVVVQPEDVVGIPGPLQLCQAAALLVAVDRPGLLGSHVGVLGGVPPLDRIRLDDRHR